MRVSGDAFVTGLITAFVGLMTALATWRAGHKQGQASFVTAVQDAAHIAIKDLREEFERGRAERTALRQELAVQHERCQAELAEMRREIEKLMAGPPASY
jgi:hypothetical protein